MEEEVAAVGSRLLLAALVAAQATGQVFWQAVLVEALLGKEVVEARPVEAAQAEAVPLEATLLALESIQMKHFVVR